MVPAHQANKLPADGQAQPGAGSRLLPGLGLLEMPEQLVLVVGRNARAGVFDFDVEERPARALAIRAARAADAALLGKLDGVAQHIDEDLTQLVDIAPRCTGERRRSSPPRSDNFFSSVRTRNIISRSLSRTGRSNVEGFSVVRPASIFDISRMSLIKARRCSPLRLMVPRYWHWRGVRSWSRSMSWENPRMAFIGVRISCDMLARKTLLARLACCNDCS